MSDSLQVVRLNSDSQYETWHCDPGTSQRTRSRDYEFVWVRHGKAVCRVEGRAYSVRSGDLLLIPPGRTVTWKFSGTEPATLCAFVFGLSGVPDSWPRPDDWPARRHMGPDDVLQPLFEYVALHAGQCHGSVSLAMDAAVRLMLTRFVRKPANEVTRRPGGMQYSSTAMGRTLQWMCEFMIRHPNRKVTVDDLAAASGVCRTHLCRLFIKQIGVGPIELLYLLRITRSLIGLRQERSVESLAAELGFSNPSHYTRRFKAVFGKTPSQMQKAMAKGYRPKLPNLPLMGT